MPVNKKAPRINIHGVRGRVPPGYLLGRANGRGRVELIGPRELQVILNSQGLGIASAKAANPPTINFFGQGLLLNNEYLGQLNFTRDVRFLQNLPTGQASCLTGPADGAQSLTLKKNGTTWATVDFALSALTGTFTCAADTDFTAGDVCTLWAPTPADSAWADISFSFSGIAL